MRRAGTSRDALAALPGAERERVELAANSVRIEADSTLKLKALVAALEHTLARYQRVRVRARGHDGAALLTFEGSAPKQAGADDGICMAVVERVAALHGGRAERGPHKLELTLSLSWACSRRSKRARSR